MRTLAEGVFGPGDDHACSAVGAQREELPLIAVVDRGDHLARRLSGRGQRRDQEIAVEMVASRELGDVRFER